MNELISEDLQIRILQLLDGELDKDEVARLDVELKNNPQARALYLQFAELHNALQTRGNSRAEIGRAPLISIERLLLRQRQSMVRKSLLAAAAVLLVSFISMWLVVAGQKHRALAYFEVAPGSVLSVTHAKGKNDISNNSLHAGSRLKLTTGMMEGELSSGVHFVVEAPCDLQILTKDRIALTEGVAWFDVPSQAIGFTVETPTFKIVDLGTQFGIMALDDKDHEIHVIKGKVEVSSILPNQGEDKFILKAGHARRINEDGKFIETPMKSHRFNTSIATALLIKNPSFEALENVNGVHDVRGYGPNANWATSGKGVGASNVEQPFLNQPPHHGDHVAFIQGKGGLSQTVSGFDPSKLYTLSYFVSERGLPNASTSTSVSLDLGTSFYIHPTLITKTDNFRRIVSGPLTVFGPSANIEIRAKAMTGDAALLIDSVSISRAVPAIPDGGFENPALSSSSFKQATGIGSGDLTASTWTFIKGGGITANRSDFLPPMAPEGSQACVLQNPGAAIETMVHGFEPGVTYSLSLEAAGRKDGAASFQVTLDGEILHFNESENLSPPKGTYKTFTSQDFTVTNPSQKLQILAVGKGATFVDDIRFNFIAEATE